RVTAEGSVYTITPRHIMPYPEAAVPEGITRPFSLTVKLADDAGPGVYEGHGRVASEKGGRLGFAPQLIVRKGKPDPGDVPVGPWSYPIDLPWYENESADWNRMMAVKSLKKLREYGFTTVSGLPVVTLKGFKDRVPQFDFSVGDAQMKLLKENG